MNKFIFIFFILILSCSKNNSTKKNYYLKGSYFQRNTKDFEKKNNLYLFSYGINTNRTIDSPPWNEIHQLETTFISLDILTLKQARKKIITCINDYLYLINNDNKLKSFLYKYPFTSNDLLFMITFYNKKGERLSKADFIHMMWICDSIVYYSITKKDESGEITYKETYQEALKNLKEEEKKNK